MLFKIESFHFKYVLLEKKHPKILGFPSQKTTDGLPIRLSQTAQLYTTVDRILNSQRSLGSSLE